jgi:hypothetical protein
MIQRVRNSEELLAMVKGLLQIDDLDIHEKALKGEGENN